MKYTLTTLVLILFIGCTENQSETVILKKHRHTNTLLYEVKTSKISWTRDSILKDERYGYTAQLATQENNNDTSIIWQLLVPDSINKQLPSDFDELENQLPGYTKMLEIEYSFDKNGRFEEIKNWDQIKQFWDSSFIHKLEQEEIIVNLNDSAFKNVLELFSSKNVIESSLTHEILAFHMIYGLPLNKSLSKMQQTMTGFDGAPILASISTQIIEESDHYLVAKITTSYDSNTVLDPMIKSIKKISPRSIINLETPKTQMNDTCITYFDKSIEAPYFVEYWRSVKIDSVYSKMHISLKQKLYYDTP